MDASFKFPGSPGTPLHVASPERVNQQRQHYDVDSPSASLRDSKHHSRESSVRDRAAAINSTNPPAPFQGKQLERKTNDAALKRAMLGREEAETEMRRYREDVKALRRQVDEGKDRERKVGERLETVMVCTAPGARVAMLIYYAGELWSSQGDTRAHSNPMGKGNKKSAQRVVQVTVCGRQAAGRAQSST